MKNLLLLFLLAFANVLAYAQGVPEKAKTIIITMPDSNMVSEKVIKVLTGRDYTIPNAGKTSSVITTAPKTLKNNTRVVYNAQIKGAEIALTGKMVVAGQSSMTIEYKGAKGSPIMSGWEEMDKIAKALGGKVKYE
jgi:hypothetical protein